MVKLRYSSKTEPAPRAWIIHVKLELGRALHRLGWKSALRVSSTERRMDPPFWQRAIEHFYASSFVFAFGLLAVCASITVVWGVTTDQNVSELWSEMGGMTLDVFFILIIYEIFAQQRVRRDAVKRHLETIDDYKRWDAPEARLRIAGALRRLGRLGVSNANFAGLRLSNFNFAEHGVPSLKGSTFYDGDWGNPLNESMVRLTRVSFSHVDCANVQFSPYDPFEALDTHATSWGRRHASFVDCTFSNTTLIGAVFNGAELAWAEAPADSHFEVEEEEDGTPYSSRVSEGPFYKADLTGAQFRGCRLKNADFRDAENLRSADFYRAIGIEEAVFDSIEDHEWVLASAARQG
jgi:uncharacterized protein YjbI with pentapeptide repeats